MPTIDADAARVIAAAAAAASIAAVIAVVALIIAVEWRLRDRSWTTALRRMSAMPPNHIERLLELAGDEAMAAALLHADRRLAGMVLGHLGGGSRTRVEACLRDVPAQRLWLQQHGTRVFISAAIRRGGHRASDAAAGASRMRAPLRCQTVAVRRSSMR